MILTIIHLTVIACYGAGPHIHLSGPRLSWQTLHWGLLCAVSFILVFQDCCLFKKTNKKTPWRCSNLPVWLVSLVLCEAHVLCAHMPSGSPSRLSFPCYSFRVRQRWLISQGGDYTPGTKSLFRHSPYREPVGKRQWCIWLCSRYWMRHYWLVNSNGAHLVMLMMMALSQQETGNQWNGPWLKWIMMLAGGPEWSKVHNMPFLIFIFALIYYLRGLI